MTKQTAGLVVPCYNEEKRLPLDALRELATSREDLHLFLVDDGSHIWKVDLQYNECELTWGKGMHKHDQPG